MSKNEKVYLFTALCFLYTWCKNNGIAISIAELSEKFNSFCSASEIEELKELLITEKNFIVTEYEKLSEVERIKACIEHVMENCIGSENTGIKKRASDSTLLQSIFTSVYEEENTNKKKYIQPKACLTPHGYMFPKEYESEEQIDYHTVWNSVYDNIVKCKNVNAFYHLCKKELWCIPFIVGESKSDVSLYEYSRLIAGLTVCYYDLCNEGRIERNETNNYILICSDVTGIQSYIYSVAHKRALNAVKGRSFFLQHMLNTFARIITESIGLLIGNIVYSSGGKFYILAPNSEKVITTLKEKFTDFEQRLLKEYNGSIGITYAYEEVSLHDFKEGANAVERWDSLSHKVNMKKLRKFENILVKSDFFEPYGVSGSVELCWATGKELCNKKDIDEHEKQRRIFDPQESDEDGDKHYISKEQNNAINIGKILAKPDSVLVIDGNTKNDFDVLDLKTFGFNDEKKISHNEVYLFNDDSFIENNVDGWMFYGGDDRYECDFDSLIQNSEGIQRLGILRMDVDNLGSVFRDGLGNKAKFPRIVQLSSMLDFFFSSYLNILRSKKWSIEEGVHDTEGERISKLIQIVYSGGDDLFIVGVWSVLPDIAIWIKEKFAEFTCENSKFSVSAGISFFAAKYPFVKAAELAGEAEHIAKGKRIVKNSDNKVEKAALCLFGEPISWKDMRVVRSYVVQIAIWIRGGMDRAIIDKLYAIHNEYEQMNKKLWERWRWRATYTLTRFAKQNSRYEKEILDFIAEILLDKKYPTDNYLVALLGVISQWADCLTRKKDE